MLRAGAARDARLEGRECWFTGSTLFKMHSAFTRSVSVNREFEARGNRRISKKEKAPSHASGCRGGCW